MKSLITAVVATSLLAAAPSAQATEVSTASSPMDHAETLGGSGVGLWVALAALALAIYLAADSGSGSPDSP